MKTTEILIALKGNKMNSLLSILVDGVVRQKAAFSQQEVEVLIAWLEKQFVGKVHACLQTSDDAEMGLALELASLLARAGHTISVGGGCRFSPAKPVAQEKMT